MKRTTIIIITAGILIAAVAAGILMINRQSRSPESRGSFPPASVEIKKVVPRQVSNILSAVGTILSNESVEIRPEVAGKIIHIGFAEGEHVAAGAVLFRLDSELIEAEYQEVNANLDFARAQYERAQNLRKNRVIADEKYDSIFRELIQAQSHLNTLATRLKKQTISAPFSGIVGARRVSVGDYVAVGQSMVHLEDLSSVKAEFYVPERHLGSLRTGQRVACRVQALSGDFTGSVYLIDPRIQSETRSAVVRARIDNPGEVLRPGMFCKVDIIVQVKDNALTVPQEAIVSRGETQFVYVDMNGTAEMRKIETGLFLHDSVEITSGINAGDMLIVSGVQKLFPGMKVRDAAADAQGAGRPHMSR